jgi:hypothetical protein
MNLVHLKDDNKTNKELTALAGTHHAANKAHHAPNQAALRYMSMCIDAYPIQSQFHHSGWHLTMTVSATFIYVARNTAYQENAKNLLTCGEVPVEELRMIEMVN